MAEARKTPLGKPAPAQMKSDVWKHFNFKMTEDGADDKSKVVCRICESELSYCRNRNHLTRYHATMLACNKPPGAAQRKLKDMLAITSQRQSQNSSAWIYARTVLSRTMDSGTSSR